MNKKMVYFLVLIGWTSLFGKETEEHFLTRVSRINRDAGIVRLRTTFPNLKYLGKNDLLGLYREGKEELACQAKILGKAPYHFLVSIYNFSECMKVIPMGTGQLIWVKAHNFSEKLNKAKNLISILLKKKAATESRLNRLKKDLEQYEERIDALNKRYQVLRGKLEKEWEEELTLMEVDKVNKYSTFQKLEKSLWDIHHKLEKYRVENRSYIKDRWSLDTRIFRRKE